MHYEFFPSGATQIPPSWCVASLLSQTPRRSSLDLLNSSQVLKYVSAVIKSSQLCRHAKMAARRRWGGAMNVYDSLSNCILFAISWIYSKEDKAKIISLARFLLRVAADSAGISLSSPGSRDCSWVLVADLSFSLGSCWDQLSCCFPV